MKLQKSRKNQNKIKIFQKLVLKQKKHKQEFKQQIIPQAKQKLKRKNIKSGKEVTHLRIWKEMVNVKHMQRRSNICVIGISKEEKLKDTNTNNKYLRN